MMTFLESILGVAPAEPGFARCRIEPHLGSLQWAKGVVPTPRGDVRVSWRRNEKGRLTFEIETPAGMPAELVLPRPKMPRTSSSTAAKSLRQVNPPRQMSDSMRGSSALRSLAGRTKANSVRATRNSGYPLHVDRSLRDRVSRLGETRPHGRDAALRWVVARQQFCQRGLCHVPRTGLKW